MYKAVKSILALCALTAVLAACSSNTTQTNEPAPTPVPTPVADVDPTSYEEPERTDPLAGIDSVFYFEFDKSVLSAQARAALTVHAQVLRSQPTAVRLEGHTDERGSREYNMALGERRANAVKDFLVLQGVDASLLEAISYGEERPVAQGSYESSWAKNRRVQLKK